MYNTNNSTEGSLPLPLRCPLGFFRHRRGIKKGEPDMKKSTQRILALAWTLILSMTAGAALAFAGRAKNQAVPGNDDTITSASYAPDGDREAHG